MHMIEPYYSWRNLYIASDDELSPFYGTEYSEFEFTNQIYDHLIHPQWDDFGSNTLFIKVLFCDYEMGFAIIEMIGEWNDCLYNDVMHLKRNIIESLSENGVEKFLLIGENVLNFHGSDDCYYEEWFDEVGEEGWIVAMNFKEHVIDEFKSIGLDNYILWGESYDAINWRTFTPENIHKKLESDITKRLGM